MGKRGQGSYFAPGPFEVMKHELQDDVFDKEIGDDEIPDAGESE